MYVQNYHVNIASKIWGLKKIASKIPCMLRNINCNQLKV